MPGRRWILAVALVMLVAPRAGASLIAVADDDNVYRVNAGTAQATLIGPTGGVLNASGLAPEWSTGRLFVSNVFLTGSIDSHGLAELNPSTGIATQVGGGDFGGAYIAGIAFASDGTLLGAPLFGPGLVEISLTTSVATLRAPLTGAADTIGGLASTPAGVFYSIDSTTLYQLNELTGVSTPIGPHGMNLTGIILETPLAYDPADGRLYSADPNDGRLFWIDPATGAATLIGNTGRSLTGLVVVGGGVTEVPALGDWGLVALAVVTCAAGCVAVRRRNR
jgi:DNA-binding beta-propeller fold protein YncE